MTPSTRMTDKRELNHDRQQDTGPLPALMQPPGENERASPETKLVVGGTAGVLAIAALIDKALSSTGLTAVDVAEQLGPLLGVLWTQFPVIGLLLLLAFVALRLNRKAHSEHTRRDKRLLRAHAEVKSEVAEVRSAVDDLRGEIQREIMGVRGYVGTAVDAAQAAAARRADKLDQEVAMLRQAQGALSERVSRGEARMDTLEKIALPTNGGKKSWFGR